MSKASGSINSWLLMGVLVLVMAIGAVVLLKQSERSSSPNEPQTAKRYKIPLPSPQDQLAQKQPAPATTISAQTPPEAPPAEKAVTAADSAQPGTKTAAVATDDKPPLDSGAAASKPATAATPAAQAVPVKPAAPQAFDPRARFPFSVSLGSYSNSDNAYKVIEQNRKTGLMPYSVKVNLGSKGTWYRVFLGYFPSKEAAVRFIADNNLKQAKTEKTRYATQIGIFPSQDKLKASTEALTKMGYYPYTLQRDADKVALLIGAYYAQSEAQKQCQLLNSAGMRCEVIER